MVGTFPDAALGTIRGAGIGIGAGDVPAASLVIDQVRLDVRPLPQELLVVGQ